MLVTKLQDCVHVFDPQSARFLKSSAQNLHKALGPAFAQLSRAQVLAQIAWKPCQSPSCKVRCCKDHAHLIGS